MAGQSQLPGGVRQGAAAFLANSSASMATSWGVKPCNKGMAVQTKGG